MTTTKRINSTKRHIAPPTKPLGRPPRVPTDDELDLLRSAETLLDDRDAVMDQVTSIDASIADRIATLLARGVPRATTARRLGLPTATVDQYLRLAQSRQDADR